MEFRVLAVGDVVGKPGLTNLGTRLRKHRRQVKSLRQEQMRFRQAML